jgi:hypothetical protein
VVIAVVGALAALVTLGARPAGATEMCATPALGFTAEETTEAGPRPRVVVRSRARDDDSIAIGDVVRQVNGTRIETCADLESAVQQATESGLVILVAVDRGGRLLALAASTEAERRAPASAIAVAPPAIAVAPAGNAAAAARPETSAAASAPAAVEAPPASPIVARPDPVAALPASASAPTAVRDAGGEAARLLASLESVARVGVPLPIYDSRVRAVESELARAIDGAGDGSGGLRAAVDGILEYYRLAGDIRRVKQEWVEDKGSESAVRAVNIPYLSTSRVPRWLAEYPFLRESVAAEPGATIFAGERSGSWNPDLAAEMVWERAREDTANLAAWSHGSAVG